MSREEAVEAYIGGRLSRRAFIRNLMAAGVTAAAAVSYAEVLSSSAQAAPRAAAQQLYYETPPAEAEAATAVQADPQLTG